MGNPVSLRIAPETTLDAAPASPVRTPRRPAGSPVDRTAATPGRRRLLRVLFALDVVGAGGPGILMLAAPEPAAKTLFYGSELTADAGTQALGCIWVALGVLSVAGLVRPVRFSPVLVLQFVYKLIWLLAVGLPAVATGRPVPPVLATIFAFWVAVVGVAAPWRLLFGKDDGEQTAAVPNKPR